MGGLRARGNDLVDPRADQVMHRQMKARLDEIFGHGLSHDSQTDESDVFYLSQRILLNQSSVIRHQSPESQPFSL
jgi:hypothetical protein